MFTGLVEDVGAIAALSPIEGGVRMSVKTNLPTVELTLGDSVAVDGTCLTVVALDDHTFDVELSAETLRCTRFSTAQRGEAVNLERALRLGDRLGGHLVQGHVDAVGTLVSVEAVGEGFEVTWELPEGILLEVVRKGSITIDGVSLTVAALAGRLATAAIIPHTADHTTITRRAIGASVNIESDMIGKYVRRVLGRLTDQREASLATLFGEEEMVS